MKKFDMNDVVTVYIGKPGHCMCGCSGNYVHTSVNARYAAKARGYKVDPDEISDKKVMLRLNRFYNDETEPEILKNSKGKPCIFTKIIGNRQITVYLKRK